MPSLKIELGKKNITLIVLLVAVLVVGVVYALTPGVAPNPGHLITQVAPPAGCGSGQVLEWSGSSWRCNDFQRELGVYDCGAKAIVKIDFTTGKVVCKDVTGVTSTQFDLVYGIHSSTQCTNLGGTVVSSGGDKLCRFASCPTGWARFKEWSTTSSNSATCKLYYRDAQFTGPYICRASFSSPITCNTGSHEFSNQAAESCSANAPGVKYCNGCNVKSVTTSATTTQRGCY